MESVITKLKSGSEDLYLSAKVGSTPVLSLLGGAAASTDRRVSVAGGGDVTGPERPFVTEANVIMYLDMIHEKVLNLYNTQRILYSVQFFSRSLS